MAELMTNKELAEYLRLHKVTILKYVAKSEMPAIRFGRVWRFNKEEIDQWRDKGQMKPQVIHKSRPKSTSESDKRQLRKKRKGKD